MSHPQSRRAGLAVIPAVRYMVEWVHGAELTACPTQGDGDGYIYTMMVWQTASADPLMLE